MVNVTCTRLLVRTPIYNTMFGNKVVNHEALAITKSTDVLCQSQANLIEKLCKTPNMSYIYVINDMTVYA